MKKVVQDLTSGGIDWQREKWQSGLGSKFIHQGEKNAAKYADEVIVLSKGVQDYFKETYGRETHFIPNGVNRPQIREASLITDKFGLKKDSYSSFRCCWKQMVWRQEKTISLKDGMMPRKMQLSFRLKQMNKVPSRLKSVQLDITSTWTYNTSKWT